GSEPERCHWAPSRRNTTTRGDWEGSGERRFAERLLAAGETQPEVRRPASRPFGRALRAKEKEAAMQVRRVSRALVALAVVFVFTALTRCARNAATQPRSPKGWSFPAMLRDDDGVSVTIKAPPRRIVTFAPSNTEIVFALGLGARLVGVSGKFDNYPPAARSIPSVGGSGQFGVDPNVERVVALHPDLMLAISGRD